LCSGIGGGLALFKKLPLLPGKHKDGIEPLDTFFAMMGLGSVYDL